MAKNTKVVYARVLETLGMDPKTAKGQATKHLKAVSVVAEDGGFVSVENAIVMLEAAYLGEKKTISKYKEQAVVAVADLKAGKVTEGMGEAIAPTASKASPFIAGKVLTVVKEYATEKGLTEVLELIANVTKSLEEEALSKKTV